jgi:hypothetical protein
MEYWSQRWECWFEAAPNNQQAEWTDAQGQPLRWRIRPAYTLSEALVQSATTKAAAEAGPNILRRLFGKTPPRSQ